MYKMMKKGTLLFLLTLSPLLNAKEYAERWYHKTVIYELWVRTFQDSDGDGIGDLKGVIDRLDYIKTLGVGAIWLMPIHPSPLKDAGYDISNYYGIHPDYGTLDDYKKLIQEAHKRDIKIILDLVLNHSSDQHPWFIESSQENSEKHDWFIWNDNPTETCEDAPPGFAWKHWTYSEQKKSYYLHQFKKNQPEYNFKNMDLQNALLDVAKFWLEIGVDGFRLDVAHRYVDNMPVCTHQEGTFDFHRRLRALADSFGDRFLLGEISGGPETITRYFSHDDDLLHASFFPEAALFQYSAIRNQVALHLRDEIEKIYRLTPKYSMHGNVMSNHDLPRPRFIIGESTDDLALAFFAQITLPGIPFVYYGDEIGMGNSAIIIDGDLRFGQRTPMHWNANKYAGFSPVKPWLPVNKDHKKVNVERQQQEKSSLLNTYKHLIHIRNTQPALQMGSYTPLRFSNSTVLGFIREYKDEKLLIVTNYNKNKTEMIRLKTDHNSMLQSVYGNAKYKINDGGLTITLDPREAIILKL